MDLSNILGIGVEAKNLTAIHVVCRAIAIFFCALIMVRVSDKRFMSKMTPFDVIIGFVIGSMLSRAINGSSPFLPTVVGAACIVVLHKLLTIISFHFHWCGKLVKGRDEVLVRNGQVDRGLLRRYQITEHDLLEAARLNGKITDVKDIKLATYERNGTISVIPSKF